MLLPIYIYGSAVLRKESEDIAKDYPELDKFLENLWETMYEADGVGLAAPQVGRNIRIFVVDASVNADKDPSLAGFKKAFINAHIYERSGDAVPFDEGCLSLPGINERVERPSRIGSATRTKISSSTTRSSKVSRRGSSSTSTTTWTANCSSTTCRRCAELC